VGDIADGNGSDIDVDTMVRVAAGEQRHETHGVQTVKFLNPMESRVSRDAATSSTTSSYPASNRPSDSDGDGDGGMRDKGARECARTSSRASMPSCTVNSKL
jgi:hypothetical protein